MEQKTHCNYMELRESTNENQNHKLLENALKTHSHSYNELIAHSQFYALLIASNHLSVGILYTFTHS